MLAFFFRRNPTNRRRITIIGVAVVAMLLLGLGLFSFPRQAADQFPVESEPEKATTADLGITYLQVTPGLSVYYNLGVSSGVLVTEVASGSPADQTGVQVGVVIRSYNGVKREWKTRFLGMIMACLMRIEEGRSNNSYLMLSMF